MSSAARRLESGFTPAVVFGLWAAAIAVARDLPAKAALAAPAALGPLAWWTVSEPGRWIGLFFFAALLLPPLPIPVGDSGPHPSMAVAALGLFCGLLRLREWRIKPSAVDAAMIALFGLMLASVGPAAFHSGATAAAGSLARVALFGISVYVYLYTAHGPDGGFRGMEGSFRRVAIVYWAAVAAALFACVDFYFQFPPPAGYGPQFVWLDSGVYRRAQGLFYEASTLGNFCVFFLVMIAAALMRRRAESPLPRKALIAGGLVFFAALVLSYSRGSLISLLVAGIVLIRANRKRIRFARVAPLMATCVAAAGIVTWKVFPAFAQMYWFRLSASAEYFFSATEGVLSGRVSSWRTLAAWAQANPLQVLFGIGYKTLPYSDYLGGPVVADNMYLSMLVETGIAGLAALVWLNVAILRAARRASRDADPARSFFGVWMLSFWAGESVQMLSGDLLTYWRVLPLYFWVLALASRA